MHVRVEIAVAENLRKKKLDPGAGEPLQVDAGLDQTVDLPDRNARHPLHHHDFTAAPVPMHFRDQQERRMAEIAA